MGCPHLLTTPFVTAHQLVVIAAVGAGDHLQAAHSYFATWQMLPLRWQGTEQRLVLPDWHQVEARPSMVSGRNRDASGEGDTQLRLRGAAESCAHSDRLPRLGPLHRLSARHPAASAGACV